MCPALGLDLLGQGDQGPGATDSRLVHLSLVVGHLLPHEHFCYIEVGVQHDPPRIVRAAVGVRPIPIWRRLGGRSVHPGSMPKGNVLKRWGNPLAKGTYCHVDRLDCFEGCDVARRLGDGIRQRPERKIEETVLI